MISRGFRAAIPPVTNPHEDLFAPLKAVLEKTQMSSTYLSLHYHVVFSTKERQPIIAKMWMPRLHQYLSGTVDGLGGISQGVGGVEDHVHLLFGLKATHCLADFMRDLKRSSSSWVNETIANQHFAWQDGYAAFTVSATAIEAVKKSGTASGVQGR